MPVAEVFNHCVIISNPNVGRFMKRDVLAAHPDLAAVNNQCILQSIQNGTEFRYPRVLDALPNLMSVSPSPNFLISTSSRDCSKERAFEVLR